MPWGRHDDKFHRSRKVKPLRRTLRGLAALGLRSILHSECLDDPELDGRITADDLRTTQERQLCESLADAGLLDRDGDDYMIHDWADYNPTKDGVERARNAGRERVARHRQRSGNGVTQPLVTDAKSVTPRARASGIPDPVPDPVPDPMPTEAVQDSNQGADQQRSAVVSGGGADAPPPRKRTRRSRGSEPALTSQTWEAYAEAYQDRYGAAPTSNARVRGQLAHFVRRVPLHEAPMIAAHYVRSSNARYVAAGHAVGPLVQDAEKLRTEWLTGRQGTARQAREVDKREGRRAEYEEMFARLRAEDDAEGRA